MPSSMLPWPTKLTTCTPRDWPMRCTRPMRCSSTAGFHGRSMLTTTAAACCRFRPDAAGVGGQEQAAVGIVVEALDQRAALARRARRRGTAHGPSRAGPRRARRRWISSCVPSHWLKTTTLAAGSSSSSSSSGHQFVDLVAVVGFLVEQIGAVAGHAHVLQRAGAAAAGRRRTGSRSCASAPRCARRCRRSRRGARAAAASAARRCGCPRARAVASAPRPCAGAASPAPASGRCGRSAR